MGLKAWPESSKHVVAYAAIGALAVGVDVSLFQGFVLARWVPEGAAAVAGTVSMCFHFTLNKYGNFRDHTRPLHQQAGTYLIVLCAWWLVTMSIITIMTRVFMQPPLLAKLIAVVVNFPMGFLAHRYLTFGKGIVATYKAWRLKPEVSI